jgi:hypothetical protein
MSRIRAAMFVLTAATALIAVSGSLPALADEVAADAAAKEVVIANDTRGSVPAPEALVAAPGLVALPVAPAKPKPVRAVQAPLVVRSTAAPAPQQHWDCSGFWCGRQFVLMLGVGY